MPAAANGLPSLAEMLADERGTEVPDRDLPGTMSRARRILLTGRAIRNDEFMAETGAHKSIFGQAVSQLEMLGFVVERTTEVVERTDGKRHPMKRCRVTNPEHEPTDADYARLTERARSRKGHTATNAAVASTALAEAQPRAASAPAVGRHRGSGDSLELPSLPGLGQGLTVYALALNDDASEITLGLRNGSQSWLVTVTGVVDH